MSKTNVNGPEDGPSLTEIKSIMFKSSIYTEIFDIIQDFLWKDFLSAAYTEYSYLEFDFTEFIINCSLTWLKFYLSQISIKEKLNSRKHYQQVPGLTRNNTINTIITLSKHQITDSFNSIFRLK